MTLSPHRPTLYPESDGQPMADNTRQFQWIVLIKENLECCFADQPDVFVAGDLLWYPVEGEPKIRVAPDVFVVFGRPKGDREASPQENRGSYHQWEEGNIAPQVVFEILSPGNRIPAMVQKQRFYQRYGVEEYYIYDPDDHQFVGLQQVDGELVEIEGIAHWTSPRLGIRFEFTPEFLTIYRPDGERFLTTIEMATERATARAEAEAERQRAALERQRADSERERADSERERVERLAAQLRALGIEPE